MGKFYDMINDFHESSKKWDPITHYTLDATHDLSTKSVGETGRLLGWDHLTNMANKDKADFGRWGGNTLGAAAAIYGGMSAAGGSGGSGGWTAGDTGLLTHASDAGGAAGAGGGGGWLNAISGGLRGGGNSMSQNAEKNQGSHERRTAEILAEILREQRQEKEPGFVNPNLVPSN